MLKNSCVAPVHTDGADQLQKDGMTIFSQCHVTIFKWWDHTRGSRVCSMRRIENLPGANRHTRPLWAELVFALDSWLRRREGVFEYSHKPDCIFRAQLSRLSSDVLLSDGTFGRPGDRVIDLHLWNAYSRLFPGLGMPLQPELRKIPW
jgi:hypothetical protein